MNKKAGMPFLPPIKTSPNGRPIGLKANSPPRKYNHSCEFCLQTANSSDVLKCTLCSVVAHSSCARRGFDFGKDLPCDSWVCIYCLESKEYEIERRRKSLDKQEKTMTLFRAQVAISRCWRGMKWRNLYNLVRKGFVALQRVFRTLLRMKAFHQKKQSRLRPMKLLIKTLSGFEATSYEAKNSNKKQFQLYLLVCVIDIASGSSVQSWRIESPMKSVNIDPSSNIYDITLNEEMILGGVSGNQHIVISVFQKGNNGRDFFMGQTSLELSKDESYWKKGGKFLCSLTDACYEIKDAAGMPIRCDARSHPAGFMDVELVIAQSMASTCCTCYGTSPEDFIRILFKSAYDGPGFVIHNRAVQGKLFDTTPTKSLSRSSSNSSLASPSNYLRSGPGFNSENSSTHGSPSPVAGVAHLSGSEKQTTIKKMWIAIFMEKIYVFNHFGDQLKLVIDLKYLNVTYELMKTNMNKIIYRVQTGSNAGMLDFHFHPYYDHDVFPVKCTMITAIMYGKKLFFKSDRIPDEISLPNLLKSPTSIVSPTRVSSPRHGTSSNHQTPRKPPAAASPSNHGSVLSRSSSATSLTPSTVAAATPADTIFELKLFLAKWTALEMLKNPDMRVKKLTSFPAPLAKSNSSKIHPVVNLASPSSDSYFNLKLGGSSGSYSKPPLTPSAAAAAGMSPLKQKSSSRLVVPSISISTDRDSDYSWEDELPNDPFLHHSLASNSGSIVVDEEHSKYYLDNVSDIDDDVDEYGEDEFESSSLFASLGSSFGSLSSLNIPSIMNSSSSSLKNSNNNNKEKNSNKKDETPFLSRFFQSSASANTTSGSSSTVGNNSQKQVRKNTSNSSSTNKLIKLPSLK
jgi:hypothetical protein